MLLPERAQGRKNKGIGMFLTPYHIRHAIRDGISIPTGAGSVQLSAGTASAARSDFTFSNSPTVTFGLNGAGVITASAAGGGGGLTNIKFSAGIASDLRSDITFSNSNGVSFGLNAGTITASVQTNYQSPGAYLTTAQPPGAYLTTAQPPGAYLTTAMPSNAGSNFVQANATFFGTNASGTIASNAISVSVAAVGIGGAGTGFTTATTAGTNVVGTLSTNGLSMGIPAYLTTAAAGGGITNVVMSAGTVSTLASAFTFSNANNVTFGMGTGASAGVITASVSDAGGSWAGTNTSVATIAGTDLTFAANTSGITIGYPKWITTAANSTVTAAGGGSAMMSFFENSPLPATLNAIPLNVNATIASAQNALYFNPFILPQAVSASYIRLLASFNAQQSSAATNTTANTTISAAFSSSIAVAFFTNMTGASTQSIGCLTSASAYIFAQTSIGAGNAGSNYTASINITWPQYGATTSTQFTSAYSNSNLGILTGQLSNFVSTRWLDIPFIGSTLSPGNYWIAVGSSSRVSLGNGYAGSLSNVHFVNWSLFGSNQFTSNIVMFGNASNRSLPMQPGLGCWSTTTALSTTNVINLTNVTLMSNQPRNIFQLLNI
jgi:hypothetical protein